jgi:hypothetical protein
MTEMVYSSLCLLVCTDSIRRFEREVLFTLGGGHSFRFFPGAIASSRRLDLGKYSQSV